MDSSSQFLDASRESAAAKTQSSSSAKPRASSPDSGVSSCPASSYCLRLPAGWERHEDDVGDYYWHVPSGTIQRDPPAAGDQPSRPRSFCLSGRGGSTPSAPPATADPAPDQSLAASSLTNSSASSASSTSNPPASAAAASLAETPHSLRFEARYLGCRQLDNSDIACSDRSSRAVNLCIRAVSGQVADCENNSQSGDRFLELDWKLLTYFDSQMASQMKHQPPRPQPLLSIRLWGASGAHFAFVSREHLTAGPRTFVCQVFQCAAAADLANALCHRCKLLLMTASSCAPASSASPASSPEPGSTAAAASLHHHEHHQRPRPLSLALFPSPQAEPQQAVPCRYLGCCLLDRLADCGTAAVDINQLNAAIDVILASRETEDSGAGSDEAVLLASPSSISIVVGDCLPARVEFRVRFLRFMGVSRRSVQLAGLVFHNAAGGAECHLCQCEPDCGPLCRTVQAACNLRYQKCLDSRTAAAAVAASAAAEEEDCSATAEETGFAEVDTSRKASFVLHNIVSLFTSIWRRNSKV